MPTIRIEQTGAPSGGAFPANLRFDDRAYPVTIRHPFDRDDDARLAWYYEQWLNFPFVGEVRAAEAAASIRRYGQALFEQLFGDRAAYARYLRLVERGLRDVTVAVSGDADFTGLLWETLWDPEQAEPLCTQATLLRQNSDPPQIDITPRPATTLNILLVVARPHFGRDVAYRTVSRPLLQAVERAQLPVRIDLVRPGTWEALNRHLEGHDSGHYHILHFDLHGALLNDNQYRAFRDPLAGNAAAGDATAGGAFPASRPHHYAPWQPPDLGQFDGQQGFLFFAGPEPGQPVPASAAQVAALLQKHGVAICILNACQSAMQGASGGWRVAGGEAEGQGSANNAESASSDADGRSWPERASEDAHSTTRQSAMQGASGGWRVAGGEAEGQGSANNAESASSDADGRSWPERASEDAHSTTRQSAMQGASGGWRVAGGEAEGQGSANNAESASSDADGRSWPERASEDAHSTTRHAPPATQKVQPTAEGGMHPEATESSLAARLMEAGVQLALGMRYSVTVTAAARLMPVIYAALVANESPAEAVRLGRVELFHDKLRHGGFDQQRPLDDWPLPVLYRNQPLEALPLRPMNDAEAADFYGRRAARYRAPALPYGFVGRDVDVLAVEQHLLGPKRSNLLLVRGLGGAGKTALLRHLAEWWSATGLIDHTVVFNYDEKPHTRQQVLWAIGEALDGPGFRPLPNEAAEQQRLLARLRAERCLLIFDNLESVTGTDLAIGHALPPDERDRLRDFLGALAGERTLVLLGSRSDEAWLRRDIPALRLYDLPGLDTGAAADLAERVLAAAGVLHYRSDPAHKPAFDRLMKLLDGHPLAIQAVLGGLAGQSPAEALAALEGGQLGELPDDALAEKSRNVLAGVHYAYSNVDPGAAALLACLAPFSGAVNAEWLPQYTAQLQAQPALADLPFGRWDEALAAAGRWGLLEPHPIGGGYRRLQPIFPFFLRRRLAEDPTRAEAVESAFIAFYEQLGGELAELIRSKDAQQRQLGVALTRVEFENLYGALKAALVSNAKFYGAFEAMYELLLAQSDARGCNAICELVMSAREQYSKEQKAGEIGVDFYLVMARWARSFLELRDYDRSEGIYRDSLEVIDGLTEITDELRGSFRAVTFHQLGYVAQEQRQWAAAEGYYQQALAIYVEFNDRYEQAGTLHQLGRVAQEQRQWAAAEGYYQQALAIKVEFNDRYSQASTLHQLGSVAQEQRQWAAAEGYYQQALAIYVEFNDRYSQAGTLHQLGMVAQEQRQWAAAEGYYRQALAIKVEFNDRYSQASTLHQLGSVAQEQRQWAAAEGYYQQALAIYVEFNDRYSQAGTLHQLGMVAQEQRQWAAAEGYYRQALAIKVEFNDRYSQANTLHQLGMVAEEQRQWAAAEGYYQQALAIYVEFNDRYSQASTLHQLGIVAQEQRQWAAAERYYQQALAIYVAFNDRYEQAGTLHQLGIVAQAQRQWAAAEGYYKEALAIFVAFNDRHSQASTLHQLGRVAEEQRQWAAAEGYYQQALAIYVEFNDRYSQASTLHQLGRVAEEQRQWAAAEGYYQQALAIKVEFNDRYSQAGTLHQLGRVAEETDQWPAAIDYYLRAAETYVQFEDGHNLGIVFDSLARVWQRSDDATLPARVAAALGASEAEVVELFQKMNAR